MVSDVYSTQTMPEIDPVSARYLWGPDLLAEGLAAHSRYATSWPKKVFIGLAGLFYLGMSFGMPILILTHRATSPEIRRNAVIALCIFVPLWAWIFHAVRHKTLLRWRCRKAFRSIPGGASLVEWSLGPVELDSRTGLTASTFLWPAFLKVVEASNGFLLYQSALFFNYIPAQGFVSEGELARFREIARTQATRYIVSGECRYLGKPVPIGTEEF